MRHLESQKSLWEEIAEGYAPGSAVDGLVQSLIEAYPLVKSAHALIKEVNSSAYGNIGSADLPVSQTDLDALLDKQMRLYQFALDIHEEIEEKVDVPLAKALGLLSEKLSAINPKKISLDASASVVSGHGLMGFSRLNLYALINPEIDNSQLKSSFVTSCESLLDPPSESFNTAMLSALTSIIGAQTFEHLATEEKDKFRSYFKKVYPEDKRKLNNVILDIINTRTGNIGEGVYVHGQGRAPYKNYRFDLGNFEENGCMAMAIYNSNVALGRYSDLSTIENEIVEEEASLIKGKMGGNPLYVQKYFEEAGYSVEATWFPSQEEMETVVQNSETSILLYAWKEPSKTIWDKTFDLGAHYVTIQFDKVITENQYMVMNHDNFEPDIVSMENLSKVKNANKLPIVIYKINKLGAE